MLEKSDREGAYALRITVACWADVAIDADGFPL